MLSSDSQWRIDLARQIATLYPAEAVLLVGSPAMGLADAYSDLDMLMFWHEIPAIETRVAITESINAYNLQIESVLSDDLALQHHDDIYYLGEHDLKIDITHKTIESQQRLIDDVVIQHEAHEYKMGSVYGLMTVVTISGEELISRWQHQIVKPPMALREKLVQLYVQMWAHKVLQVLLIERGDVLYAKRAITEMCEKVVYLLVVINGQYPPIRLKHLHYVIDSLEIKPINLLERITQICNLSPDSALPIAVQLVEDTFDIVSNQGYDITNARKHFKIERKPNYQTIQFNEESNTND